ncbi:MAG: ABC transporter substrate-binding protein [Proteobacteria bacterium]|nr:ABC transporter substrate-binding protein [Pseudomonadota bacterium]MBU1457031.1 ABC transporter substrate-binding protein [Pseudomonadota bacterium]
MFISTASIEVAAAQSPESEPVTIQLRWSHQFQFAGYYAALEKGYYTDEGLEVTLAEAPAGKDRVKPILEGTAHYGIGDSGILKLRSDGQPLVVLAQIFQHSPNILITRRDSNILDPHELTGKTVMLSKEPASSAAVRAMLQEALGSLDRVTVLPRTRDEELIDSQADAVAGYLSNEPFHYRQKGLPINIIDPRSYGIDFYGDNLFTTDDEIRNNPERVKKVLKATLKGWDYALKNKEEIIDIILAKYNPALNREKLRFEAKVIDQMILPDLIPIGDIHPKRYARIAELYHRLGLSASPELPDGFLYRQTPASADLLTGEERAWLKAHPGIRFAYTNDFQPALIVHEDGRQEGILKDLLDILNQRLGTDFTIITDDLPAIRSMIKNREVAGPLALSPAAAERYQLLQTGTLLTGFPVIYAGPNTNGTITGIKDLTGRKCAIVGGMPTFEGLVKPYENLIKITRTKTTIEALTLLFEGKVEFFIGFAQQNYLVHTSGFVGVKPVLALTEHQFQSVMGVREDWPELVGILNKGLAAISKEERNAIYARWIKLPKSISASRVSLSPQEKNWIAKKQTVKVGISDLPPFVLVEEGRQPSGITIDILGLLSESTGIDFSYEMLPVSLDDCTYNINKPDGPDLLQCLRPHLETVDHSLHSKMFMQTPRVVFTEMNAQPVNGIQDLFGRTLSVKEGSPLNRLISQDYPEIKLLLCGTEQDALKAVQLGKAEFYIGTLTMSSQMIARNGWNSLKVAGPSGLEDLGLFFEIRSDQPELLSIINKGLENIGEEERIAIRNKYMTVRYEHGISSGEVIKWITAVGGVSGGLLLVIFFWNRTLASRVRTRTDDLHITNKQLLTEVGERKRAEEEVKASEQVLLKSERLARMLLNAPSDLIQLIDEDGTILDLNKAMAERLKRPRAEVIGTCVFDHFTEEEKARRKAFLNQVISQKAPHCFIDKGLAGRIFETAIYPIETQKGEKRQFVVFASDITDRESAKKEKMALQNDLEHMNRLMTMNELAASLAHEINQPLGAILNNATAAQIMFDDLAQGNVEIRETLEDIAVDAYRAGQIIRKIRGIVRKEESKFELLDVNLILDEVVELFRNMFNIENITLHLDKQPNLPRVSGDRIRLQQVVMNLISNALDAMRSNDLSILTVRSSVQLPEGVTVSIIDTGIGIDDSLKDKLFDPFFTTKKSGLGIGLRLCRAIIDEHGGRIWVDDNPEGGTIFHFTLKADQENFE